MEIDTENMFSTVSPVVPRGVATMFMVYKWFSLNARKFLCLLNIQRTQEAKWFSYNVRDIKLDLLE